MEKYEFIPNPNIKPIDYTKILQCELCGKEKARSEMYLTCGICHKVFCCFSCGIVERNKAAMGLPCAIYNKTYRIKCAKHVRLKPAEIIEDECCEMGTQCEICCYRAAMKNDK